MMSALSAQVHVCKTMFLTADLLCSDLAHSFTPRAIPEDTRSQVVRPELVMAAMPERLLFGCWRAAAALIRSLTVCCSAACTRTSDPP